MESGNEGDLFPLGYKGENCRLACRCSAPAFPYLQVKSTLVNVDDVPSLPSNHLPSKDLPVSDHIRVVPRNGDSGHIFL